ncbi:hypoxia up-regulated protein 1-like isoform X2 [Oscarella lobularis]|uniref:hypoxia up-regulated protein 1-like isoform X2 n=1 Tax=Oscarella lobularis TaxID=121494 RepID=UPI003314304B
MIFAFDSTRFRVAALLIVLATLLQCHSGAGVAVMSIDFGSEWLKIALVKPGVPMEIVLNKESQRKTANVVSLKGNERLFAGPAQTASVRHPKNAYKYLQHLIGKKYDSPHVELFKKRFPYYDLTKDVIRDTVIFQHDGNTTYSVEELLAMIFKNAKSVAEAYADQPIQDVVITVPPFFNQAERRSVLNAAKLGQLKVLQLMNDNTAFALNYGVFRRADFNATPTNILFYDMGSSSTVATLASYQTVKIKEGTISETVPQLTVKGVGYDPYLGGLDFDLKMREILVKKFLDQGKYKSDVTKSVRAMAKLLKEANRVKTVLSANTEHLSQIEGLIDDIDFRAIVTREEFEIACADLFERVQRPVEEALKSSQITMMEVDQVIIIGGGSRIPKVQELLLKTVERSELGKSLNADEAAALGAVYVGAFLSKAFRVKKFAIKDANLFPIQVSFEKDRIDDEGVASVRRVTRTLFNRNNPFPQKKVMTFNKQNKDFALTLDYGEIDFLSREQLSFLGSLNLTKASFSGVETVMSKHSGSGIESKGIKAHFQLDGSGLIGIEKVEAVFEKPPEAEAEQSAFERLGNTISSFFGSSKEEEKEKSDTETKSASETEEEMSSDETEKTDTETKSASEEEMSSDETEKTDTETKSASEEEINSDKTDESKRAGDTNADETSRDDDDTKDETEAEKETKEDETDKPASEEKEDSPPPPPEESKESKESETSKDEVPQSEAPQNATTSSNATETDKPKNATVAKPKPSVIRETIDVTWEIIDLDELRENVLEESEKKLRELDERDEEKLKREKAVNTLESFVYETQDKIESELLQSVSTEEEREKISKELSETSDWLYEDGMDATRKEYEEKLKTLKALCRPVFVRANERSVLPQAIADLKKSLNLSTAFHRQASNLSEYEQIYTDVELTKLIEVINETKDWLNDAEIRHNATTPKDDPVVTVSDVHEKGTKLDREVMYLINKAKWAKPLKKRNETASEAKSAKNATKIDDKASNDTEEASTTPGDSEKATEETKSDEKPAEKPETVESSEEIKVPEDDAASDEKTDGVEADLGGSEDDSKLHHDKGEL